VIFRFFCVLSCISGFISALICYIYPLFLYIYSAFSTPDTVRRMFYPFSDTAQSVSEANYPQEIPRLPVVFRRIVSKISDFHNYAILCILFFKIT